MSKVRLDLFDNRKGLERGRSKIVEILWYIVKVIFFLSAWPWPMRLKVFLLRLFGAKVGKGLIIKPRVNIHLPWKLEIGDHVWVGEEAYILNFEKTILEDHVCVSQRAFLCGGNHDYRSIDFQYRNGEIILKHGAWIGANSFVAPGITVHKYTVVSAGSVVLNDLPGDMVCSGNPCIPKKSRWKKR